MFLGAEHALVVTLLVLAALTDAKDNLMFYNIWEILQFLQVEIEEQNQQKLISAEKHHAKSLVKNNNIGHTRNHSFVKFSVF